MQNAKCKILPPKNFSRTRCSYVIYSQLCILMYFTTQQQWQQRPKQKSDTQTQTDTHTHRHTQINEYRKKLRDLSNNFFHALHNRNARKKLFYCKAIGNNGLINYASCSKNFFLQKWEGAILMLKLEILTKNIEMCGILTNF